MLAERTLSSALAMTRKTQHSPARMAATPAIQPAAFDTAGARAYLGGVYTVAALVKRRQRGLGPPFRRDEAGRILYLRSDLDRFLQSLPRG